MRFAFAQLPYQGTPRPVVNVAFPGLPGVHVPALVDSGALANRFDVAYADQLGLDLTQAEPDRFTIAGREYFSHVCTIRLKVGRWDWFAPVGFVESWQHAHGVLGLRGFFDEFSARIEAASSHLVLQRRPRATGPYDVPGSGPPDQ